MSEQTKPHKFWATPDDLDFAYDIGGVAAIYKGKDAERYAQEIAALPALLAERQALREALQYAEIALANAKSFGGEKPLPPLEQRCVVVALEGARAALAESKS